MHEFAIELPEQPTQTATTREHLHHSSSASAFDASRTYLHPLTSCHHDGSHIIYIYLSIYICIFVSRCPFILHYLTLYCCIIATLNTVQYIPYNSYIHTSIHTISHSPLAHNLSEHLSCLIGQYWLHRYDYWNLSYY